MTVNDLPHALTTIPHIFAGCLIAAAVLTDLYWTARNWRTR